MASPSAWLGLEESRVVDVDCGQGGTPDLHTMVAVKVVRAKDGKDMGEFDIRSVDDLQAKFYAKRTWRAAPRMIASRAPRA